MRLTHIFVGIFVFVLFGIIIMDTAMKLNDEYGTTTDDDFMQLYQNITQSEDDLSELIGEGIAADAPGGITSTNLEDSTDYEGGVIRSSWKALSKIPSIFLVFKRMSGVLISKLGINPLFFSVGFGIFVIVITFILISSILRHRL